MPDTPLSELNAWHLANIADCGTPDRLDSPGALVLLSVRDRVAEYLANPDDDTEDAAHEIADGSPSIYTHELWTEFVDLAAYNEDDELADYGGADTLTGSAMLAVYVIARRLAATLLTDYAPEEED